MIGIVDYGMGNLQSVKNACEFLGQGVLYIKEENQFNQVSHLVLPGVGSFSRGIDNLEKLGFITLLKKRVLENKIPLLGICLGMQLLADRGTEGGERKGLGFIPGAALKLDDSTVRIPHVGWNSVNVLKKNRFLPQKKTNIDYYFVHSYYFDAHDKNDVIATCKYGQIFPCVIGRDHIFGVQFHPEKSHKYGLEILKNFFKFSS